MKEYGEIKNTVVEIGDGYWVMLQEGVEEVDNLYFYICHEKYATWMFCFGIPYFMITNSESNFKWDEKSVQEAVNTFIELAEHFIEDYKNKIEKYNSVS